MGWRGRLGLATPLAALAIALHAAPALTPQPEGGGAPAASPPEQLLPRTLQDPSLDELSGLAASRIHPGIIYGINDSGGRAEVYAIDGAGATAARLRLLGLDSRDWEALAPGWDGEGRPVLWIGDIGDNASDQQRVRLVRIAEPVELVDQEVGWEAYWVAYPDGPHNAEALLFHPHSGELAVVTKSTGGAGGMYRVPPLRAGVTNVMERVMDVPPGITDGAWEASPLGEPRLVLVDYWQLHRFAGDGWVSALAPLQLQREAMAWPWLPGSAPGPARDQVHLGSEGRNSRVLVATVP